jgi:GMP synthase PP-ATPase subunit
MKQAGRKSSAQLSIVRDLDDIALLSRVSPPDGLTDEQRQLFLVIVGSRPAEWFGDEHVPLLVELVRHVSTSNLITKQIEGIAVDTLQDDKILERLHKLASMRVKEANVINTLMRSMRLTLQALYRAHNAANLAAKESGKRKPWQTQE